MKRRTGGKNKLAVIGWICGGFLLLALVAVLVQAYLAKIDWRDVLGETTRKNEIISVLKADILRSVEAEKYAVLADTDEESELFARQSLSASEAVEANLEKLRALVDSGRIEGETRLLRDFDNCWKEFRSIDQKLLEFAVQNTNLKAARLSFTRAKEALKRFQSDLTLIMSGASSAGKGPETANAAFTALAAAFEIYSLQGPHIIETKDEVMDRIENSMALADSQVKDALKKLEGLLQGEGSGQLSRAEVAFSEFEAINREIVSLSRQNTNIRSMELSLGSKRKITAECLDNLNALQQTVTSRPFKATR